MQHDEQDSDKYSDTSVPSTSFLDQNNNSTSSIKCDKVKVSGKKAIGSFLEVDDSIEEILSFADS